LVLPVPRLTPGLLRAVGGIAGVLLVAITLSKLLGGDGRVVPISRGPDEEELRRWREVVENAAVEGALGLGMSRGWIHTYPPASPEGDSLLTVLEFRVPGDLHIEVLNLALTRAVEESGGEIARGIELSDTRVELDVAFRGRRTHRLVLQRYSGYRRQAGRLSIIIDDFGTAAQEMLVQFAELDVPWTATVIPGYTYSANQARYLSSRGIPVLVHMPMEPEAAKPRPPTSWAASSLMMSPNMLVVTSTS